jgi:hypothetical protein
MYLAAANTQFQTDSLFDMQFGLLNGEREVIGPYLEFTLQNRKCTATEGEKNCKLPQEETPTNEQYPPPSNSVANSNDHQHGSNSIIYKTWQKKKSGMLELYTKKSQILQT